MEKPKPNKTKGPSGQPTKSQPGKPAATPAAPPPPVKVAPLFRKIDWLVFIISFAAIWIAYLWTLAPDLTLEDSGELCTASFYAGIPHPPGYPFWSIYSYFWTHLPFGSVTWRVEVGESFAGAIACGLVGLMVSRGSSMLIEGIQELNDAINRNWETAICIVCGITAGLLLGFDDFMWKESVVINRISVFDVPWLMLVAACLMRWVYAPHQRRYLYVAMFFFGLCFTIHQTMLVAAMGIEAVIAMAHQRYGRSFCLGNSIIYIAVLLVSEAGLLPAYTNLDVMFRAIFHVVGILSIAGYAFLTFHTKESSKELARDAALAGMFIFPCLVPKLGSFGLLLSFASLVAFVYFVYFTWRRDLGWLIVGICGVLWMFGAGFFFYEPISGMTDPPMQWGYPRTVEGFFHAFTRGQYESAHPVNILEEKTRFIMQLGLLVNGLANSYSWVFLFVALLPFLFILKMQKRERGWIIGLTAIYLCVGVLLTIIMNTTPDRQSAEENKVFFTASHGIVAILIGYGLALMSAYMATHYQRFRPMALILGAVTIVPALTLLFDSVCTTFYGGAGLLEYIKVLVLFLSLAVAFVLTAMAAQKFLMLKANPATATQDDRFYLQMFIGAAAVFLCFSIYLAFFSRNGFSMGEVFGALPRIFAPHQYSSPVIGALILFVAVLVFLGSLFAYKNRAPVAITLALFMLTPLYSGLTHWAKGEERNHWFGYWFGHDMFTPPFEGPDGKFSYDPKLREQMLKDPVRGKLTYPEMDKNTILFGGTDPGRFCPTYMIFCESFVPPSCKPMDPNFDRRDVYLITQNALADGTYLDYLRAQYFRSQQIDPPFFSRFFRFVACTIGLGNRNNVVMNLNDPDAGKGNSGSAIVEGIASLLDKCLDAPFTKLGAKIETRRRAEGVYPPKEIYIPSPEDSEKAFRDYTEDVARREQIGRLQPGEDVNVDKVTGRVQVSGQVAVMMINGLLCKVIFDHNPTNAFYVEESFPLEWMYPYETPYGIIMKINRNPLQSLPEDVLKRDHEFWSKYCERFIGTNVVTDTTSVGDICTNFVEKVYLQHNYSGFKGDLKFLRDEDAQKAFSKLRDSQAGMYAWRLRLLLPPEVTHESDEYLTYRPKSETEIQQLYKEADFAFKQSFAFCPYSPETVVRYVNFLYQFNRFDDALLIAQTCKKLDPYNTQMDDIINQIGEIKKQYGQRDKAMADIQEMETRAREHPEDIQNLLALGNLYLGMQDTQHAVETLDRALTNPAITYNQAAGIAQLYSRLGNLDKLEATLKRLAELAPDQPEAHYDLAAIEIVRGETNQSLDQLRVAMDLNAKRLKSDPNAHDLAATNRIDARFDSVRGMPEFQKIVSPK